MTARIALAGRIEVSAGGRRTDERDLPGAQVRLAFCLLVWHRDRPVSREELAENLWPHGRPATWAAALRGVVSRVRSFLVAAGLGPPRVLRAVGGAYRLQLPELSVDLEQAGSDVGRAEERLGAGDAASAAELAAAARAVLVRPLLPGVEAPWLDTARRELARALGSALETLSAARLALGEHRSAAASAAEAVELDPFRESAHRLLIRAHQAAADPAAGLAAYEACRRLLARELGTAPAPETRELHAQLLRVTDPTPPPCAPPAAAGPEPAPGAVPCPYRGLQTFEEDDAGLFFGRTGDVTRLLDRLRDARFLAVVGPSGSGKSSLVRAGLVPALRRGALPGSDTWPVTVVRPGPQPVVTLHRALGWQGAEPAPGGPGPATRDVAAAARRGPRRLLVVDQLEEAFTLHADADQRRLFLDLLVATATASDGRVSVVVTVRADHYPALADHPRLADLASTNQFLVTAMDAVGLAEVVEGPAHAVGLRLAHGLRDTVLRDVPRRPGALPLLGYCLLQLWEHRTDGVLTLGAYRRIGGVGGALARRAEQLYRELRADEQVVARQVLLRLVQPEQAGDEARRRVAVSELASEGHTERVEAVLSRLTAARLLVTGGPPETDRWVELSHEILIRGWPRLHRWVEDDRAGLRVHRRLTGAAAEWERLNRDEGALYRGAALAEATAWAEEYPDAANPQERTFLRASVQAVEAGRRRRVGRLRLLAAGLAIGLLAVTVLASAAWVERERAEHQRQLAQSRQLAADALAQLDLDPARGLDLAVRAVETADTPQAVGALRRALVTPQPRLALPGGRGDLAVDPDGRLVAVGSRDGTARLWNLATGEPGPVLGGHTGAVHRVFFGAGGDLLLTTDEAGVRIWDLPGAEQRHVLDHGRPVYGAAISPDGRRVATAGSLDDGVRVWDLASGRELARVPAPGPVSFVRFAPGGQRLLAWSAVHPSLYLLAADTPPVVLAGHAGAAVDARIGPDGRHVVTVGLDGAARIWEMDSGEQVGLIDGFDEAVWAVRFSPDGSLVVVGDGTGAVRVAEVPRGQVRVELGAHTDAIVDAAFSPDGSLVATAGLDGRVQVWDLVNARPRGEIVLDGTALLDVGRRSVLFTPDGRQLVTRAATVQVWGVPPGPRAVLDGHERPVGALALSPHGETLASGGLDGTARLWRLPAGVPRRTFEVAGSSVTGVSFSPGGDRLATANPFHATLSERDLPPTIWDVATGAPVRTLPVPEPTGARCPGVCQTTSAVFAPDGATLVTAGQDGIVRRWNASDGTLVAVFDPVEPARELHRIALSADGQWVAAAAGDAVLVWDALTGEPARELPAAGRAVAFAPTGDLLAAAGDDGIVTLWRAGTGAAVGRLPHSAVVRGVAWSPDGRFVLVAAGDGARLWDVASLRLLQVFGGGGGTHAVAFTPDAEIVAGAADGSISIHRCTVCGPLPELLDAARDPSGP